MEKYSLKEDIKVFYVKAESFPEGITVAHEKLHSMLPSKEGRHFFGISYPDQNYQIIYRAAVKESYPGEAEKYGCDTFVIRKGEYISETIHGWQKDVPGIAKTFEKLLSNPHIDRKGYCLEEYLGENDMRCMVGLSN